MTKGRWKGEHPSEHLKSKRRGRRWEKIPKQKRFKSTKKNIGTRQGVLE